MPLLGVNTKARPLGTARQPAQDLDVARLRLFGTRAKAAELRNSVTGMDLEMTIDGASTLTIKVSDWHRGLLRSQLLQEASWVNLDGVEYTLSKISHDADELTLIFEETVVHLLRRYNEPKKANRDNTTRAQFIRGMVNEVRERRIPFSCPELNLKQRVA
jgi:hypothetical protein